MTEQSSAGQRDTQQADAAQFAVAPDAVLLTESPSVLALTLAYEGTHFSGFARQEGQSTVQGELERALKTVFHREVLTVGAGRTDAGVHALGNVVSLELLPEELEERSFDRLQSALNALTPDTMVVKRVEQKEAGFSARFSAQSREYRYRFYRSKTPPIFLEPYVWWVKTDQPLDITAMKKAVKYFEGEHDFRSFCVAKSADLGPTQRNISKVLVFGMQHLGEHCMVVQIIGNAFLHSMVRVMVGTLMEVAQRKQEPEWILDVLEARDRRAAGQTAPAKGLTLWRVNY